MAVDAKTGLWTGKGRPPHGWPKDERGRPLTPGTVAAMRTGATTVPDATTTALLGLPSEPTGRAVQSVPAPPAPPTTSRLAPAYRKAPHPEYVDLVPVRMHEPGPGSGAPQYTINEKGLELIAELSAQGNATATIATNLGMHPTTFARIRKSQPAVEAALQIGLGCLQDELVDRLLAKSRDGCLVSTIYLAKARCHLWDRPAPDTSKNDAPTVNLTINAPLTDEQFGKLVHIEAVPARREPDEE